MRIITSPSVSTLMPALRIPTSAAVWPSPFLTAPASPITTTTTLHRQSVAASPSDRFLPPFKRLRRGGEREWMDYLQTQPSDCSDSEIRCHLRAAVNECTRRLPDVDKTMCLGSMNGTVVALGVGRRRFIAALHVDAALRTAAEVDGGGSGESRADESEVQGCPNLRPSRRTGPGCASCRYSMMMLVSMMLRSLSTSSGKRSGQRLRQYPRLRVAATGSNRPTRGHTIAHFPRQKAAVQFFQPLPAVARPNGCRRKLHDRP